jgi:tyrosyl-tRNA synthetase
MSDDEISQCLAGHPRQAKDALARNITSQIHGADAANTAAEVFVQQFVKNEIPDEINECIVGESAMKLASLLKEAGLVASTSEARRLLADGAVKVNSEPQSDPNLLVELSATDAVLLQIGKRRLINVRYASR